MIHVKDINKYTGYIRGGCSPVGMKKKYSTYIDKTAEKLNTIMVSGGKIGTQIEISAMDLVKVVKGKLENLTK